MENGLLAGVVTLKNNIDRLNTYRYEKRIDFDILFLCQPLGLLHKLVHDSIQVKCRYLMVKLLLVLSDECSGMRTYNLISILKCTQRPQRSNPMRWPWFSRKTTSLITIMPRMGIRRTYCYLPLTSKEIFPRNLKRI